MRGHQLMQMARVESIGRPVSYEPLRLGVRNSVVFLTKGALRAMTIEVLDDLKRGGNRLLFDVVDEQPPGYTEAYADVIIASSITGSITLGRQFPSSPVALVNHHVDPRVIDSRITPPTDRLRLAYFGEVVNTRVPDALTDRVDVVGVDTARQNSEWISQLPGYNAHYAIRATRDLDYSKPFLKGFTAAHCNAVVVIQRDQVEAELWLGPDYPYFSEGDDDGAVLSVVERMEGEFASSVWHSALDRMADIRHRTSPKRIVAELRAACAL